MLAEDFARVGFDGPRRCAQVTCQEVGKRSLADEAYSGAVGLVEDRQPRGMSALSHLVFAQVADREHGLRKRVRRNAMQKVALILGLVGAFQQSACTRAVHYTSIMAGGDPSGAQSPHIVQTDAELDFPITQNIGIRRAPGRVFSQEICQYALAIFGRKADPMQRDPELVADFAGVLEILGGRADRKSTRLNSSHL